MIAFNYTKNFIVNFKVLPLCNKLPPKKILHDIHSMLLVTLDTDIYIAINMRNLLQFLKLHEIQNILRSDFWHPDVC